MAVTVCIIDDDEIIRETARELLEDAGYTVVEAADAVHGLALLRESAERLVVLLDYFMPAGNGEAILRQVMRDDLLLRHAYILFTAAPMAIPEDIRAFLAATRTPILTKPYEIDDLYQAVTVGWTRLR